jgi:hypothetical protein
MVKLTKGQKVVLIMASVPMAATGIAGGVASFFNFRNILDGGASAALSIVAAGEGATLVAALVMLALTLLGQHTPAPARFALWALPAVASVAGGILADDLKMKVVMVAAPLAMTVSGEGVTLVARRIVAFQTGVDIEQQRRSGLLLWHANRAANGSGLAKKRSELAVWRLTKQFAATDSQMSVQLGEVQRYRIGEGADVNLARVLSGETATKAPELPRAVPAPPVTPELPAAPSQAATEPHSGSGFGADDPDGYGFVKGVLAEAEEQVATDTTVKLLTVADVAALKGVAPGTVRSWVNRGKLAVADRDDDGRSLFHPLTVADLD